MLAEHHFIVNGTPPKEPQTNARTQKLDGELVAVAEGSTGSVGRAHEQVKVVVGELDDLEKFVAGVLKA